MEILFIIVAVIIIPLALCGWYDDFRAWRAKKRLAKREERRVRTGRTIYMEGMGTSFFTLAFWDLGEDALFSSSWPPVWRVALWPSKDMKLRQDEVFVGLHWLFPDHTYGGHILDKKLTYDGRGCFCEDFHLKGLTFINDIPMNIKNLIVYPVVYFDPDGSSEKAWYKSSLQDAEKSKLVKTMVDEKSFDFLRTTIPVTK